jgi:hypothetical protein
LGRGLVFFWGGGGGGGGGGGRPPMHSQAAGDMATSESHRHHQVCLDRAASEKEVANPCIVRVFFSPVFFLPSTSTPSIHHLPSHGHEQGKIFMPSSSSLSPSSSLPHLSQTPSIVCVHFFLFSSSSSSSSSFSFSSSSSSSSSPPYPFSSPLRSPLRAARDLSSTIGITQVHSSARHTRTASGLANPFHHLPRRPSHGVVESNLSRTSRGTPPHAHTHAHAPACMHDEYFILLTPPPPPLHTDFLMPKVYIDVMNMHVG